MRRVTIDIDEWVLQEAAAALDASSVADTVHRALVEATVVARGRRDAARVERWRRSAPRPQAGRRRRLS